MRRLPAELWQRLVLGAAAVLVTSVVGWPVLRSAGPWLINASTESRVLRAVIGVFGGLRSVPVDERVASFEQWLVLAVVSGVVVGLGLAGAALAVRAGLHRRSDAA